MVEYEIDLVKEHTDHDLTKATMDETRAMSLRVISELKTRLEQVIQERNQLKEIIAGQEDTVDGQGADSINPKVYPKMRKERSKSDVSDKKVSEIFFVMLKFHSLQFAGESQRCAKACSKW